MQTKKILLLSLLLWGMLFWTVLASSYSKNGFLLLIDHNYHNTNVIKITSDIAITITSNNQFETYNFPGSGTADDPYRIENLNINASNKVLIEINNSNVHFIISGCTLNGISTTKTGIALNNVAFGTIENNTINTHQEDGIIGVNISACTFRNNQVYNNNRFGIFLLNSSNCRIDSNFIHDSQLNGVHIKDCQNITLNDNEIYNQRYGIYTPSGLVLESSSEVQIENNSFHDNYQGINFINSAEKNQITNNVIRNNLKYGVRLEYSSENTILSNTIKENREYGIKITQGSRDNRIQLNEMTGNNDGGRQASDDGNNNEFRGNYWSDGDNNDTNEDLIADNPYLIAGTATNSDPYPLVNLSQEALDNLERKLYPPNNQLIPIIILIGLGGGTGVGYVNYSYKKKKRIKMINDGENEPINENITVDLLNRLKPLYHKLIVGLDYIQAYFFPQPVTVPLLTAAEPTTLAEYFPTGIKEDLQAGMKWRTIQTLIEIAYQDPSDTNPKKLADSLQLPLPTVSREIKKLKDLEYIEAFVSAQVMRDGRYRSYTITQKGYELLYTLKETLKLTITRLKEQDEVNYANN
ncbi:MAG: right-handed parallel beta-helix repeat-containing protein [Candidatus Hodarchaeales archaeon]